MDAVTIAIITGTFLLAGLVKGIAGMGMPTVAMALLGTFLTPVAAAAMLVVPTVVTNIWQMVVGRSLAALVARLWVMMASLALGTLIGSWVLTSGPTGAATFALGTVLMVYALASLLRWELVIPGKRERRFSPVVGIVTGLIGGGTAIFTIPAVPYLQGIGLEKDDLVQALGLTFTVATLSLAAGLGWGGAFNLDMAAVSTFAVLPAIAGMALGQRVRGRIEADTFRRWFLIALLLIGGNLILRSLI